MMISTRGRYALRVMIDLAEHTEKTKPEATAAPDQKFIPMKEVADRQGISLKYLERIIPALVKEGLIEGVHGKGGGYRLTRKPTEYSVGEILRLTEGDLAPVSCLECGAAPCDRRDICKTFAMWKHFHEMTNEYFDGITVADLVCEKYGL